MIGFLALCWMIGWELAAEGEYQRQRAFCDREDNRRLRRENAELRAELCERRGRRGWSRR